MDTGQLEAFERIVREGSFSRAALALDISQPTISARIRALEAEVGEPLFNRGGRQVSLTPAGEGFLPYVQRVLALLREGQEAARLATLGHGGRVTVGVIESLTGGFLASAVEHFHQSRSRVELFIRSGHTHQIVQMLQDGLVQLGLLAWPLFNAEILPLLLFREPLSLVVHPSHPLALRGEVTLEEAARQGEPLLHVRWGPSVQHLLARLEGLPVTPVEVPIDTAHQMVLHGIGAAFLTQTLITEPLNAGLLVRVPITDLAPLVRESALVRLRRVSLPPATEDFVRIVGETAARLKILE